MKHTARYKTWEAFRIFCAGSDIADRGVPLFLDDYLLV